MNRANYFNYIEEKLTWLQTRIKNRASINLLDLNIHSESFFAGLCNVIFNLKLVNVNYTTPNFEGIDLVDEANGIIVQVSSTLSKSKIEDSLKKVDCQKFGDYSFRFISIADKVGQEFRKGVFRNPGHLRFNASEDIWDVPFLLREISMMDVERLRDVYNFVVSELGEERDCRHVESNIARIINVLSAEKLNFDETDLNLNPFAIEDKIEFNELGDVRWLIEDYKVYYHVIEEKYRIFDELGTNVRFTVLQEIRKQYIILSSEYSSPRRVFWELIDRIADIVQKSDNYVELPFEELDAAVGILVVDAFLRCRIFRNPGGYRYVTAD